MSQPPDERTPAPVAVTLDRRTVWRAAWVVIAAFALLWLAQFTISEGSSILVVIVLAFFAAFAIDRPVTALARHMPRPAAALLVMGALGLAAVIFVALFGGLLAQQLTSLVTGIPGYATTTLDWVNQRFGTQYSANQILTNLGLTTSTLTGWATSVAGGLLGVLTGTLTALLGAFAFVFMSYYLTAGMPRLRLWVAGLFRPRTQVVVLTVWDLILTKVGGYVSARLILAAISSVCHGGFMALIGMPYWLPLALWTGLVAQFVPNVGTYIAIVLPVVVGLSSGNPMLGLYILAFAIAYQQVENLTIEPRISARAVDVHPAVSFGAAMLGAQLFGVAGALLAVPVAATLVAVVDIYKERYEVTASIEGEVAQQLASLSASEAIQEDAVAAAQEVEREAAQEVEREAGSEAEKSP